jgi:hypothetical protein
MQNNLAWRTRGRACRTLSVVVSVGLFVAVRTALSAPVVQQVSGTFDHKGTITIRGTGFGSKPTAAPLVWDDATGNTILDKWDGAWPNLLPGYNTGYYNPMNGVSPPHSHDARYIAGAHAGSVGAYSGIDVVFFKNFPLQAFPFYVYASWYQRADSHWVFGGDNNYKTFAYSVCCSPYELPNDWFTAYGPPHPGSITDSAQWTIGDNANSLQNPDANGNNAWWDSGVNPMAGEWAKVEIAVKVTSQTDGYVKVWENGRQVMNYAGSTDKYAGNRRTVGIGGFARNAGLQNWRYFADAYLDTTLTRVVLADKPVLAQATIIENQIPSAWTDSSITATVNLGRFAQGQSAYLFVVDSSGTASAAGLAATAGGTAAAAAAVPNPPSAVGVK